MRVVNCKVKYLRPRYNNLKEWVEDESNVYIGRAGVVFIENGEGKKERYPKKASIFANPFKTGKDGTRAEVLRKYKEHILEKLKNGDLARAELSRLRGKTLGCWCKPEPCHGDVLVELTEGCREASGARSSDS